MASFSPFKDHIIKELDELIQRYSLKGPFLDAGCGLGDVALHLSKKGWAGFAVDMSEVALETARSELAHVSSVEVISGNLLNLAELLKGAIVETVVMFDVLEHVEDDHAVLSAVSSVQPKGGHLIMTIPSHPQREWRWDDDYYGHLRRYDLNVLEQMLRDNGYSIIEMWDITYPALWLMRRVYTAIKPAPKMEGTPIERSMISTGLQAWDMGVISWMVLNLMPWRLVSKWISMNRHQYERGHEVIVLAKKS